jgi:Histidine kinase-, DNA gyrase B-, and HSP90-like ATPase
LAQNYFQIKDNCGGISVEDAKNEVFRLGHHKEASQGQLGVYGIGLKRAIFKIGRLITIESKTKSEGWRMVIDVDVWAANDETDWELPFDVIPGTNDESQIGTTINIKKFSAEISERLKSSTVIANLKEMIETTYCLFLNRYVTVILNRAEMIPIEIPFGMSEQVNIAQEEFTEHGVDVSMFAGLASRGKNGEWRQEVSGWYIACNGRLVVAADRTQTTGWGDLLPLFVPKYRGFVGLVFFHSKDPLSLPWKTTKQGINTESLVFQRTRSRMTLLARPIVDFLNNMFPSDSEKERESQRIVAQSVTNKDIRTLVRSTSIPFKVTLKSPLDPEVSVNFTVKEKDIARIKKHLGKSWSARQIAKFTFDYYLKTECPE